ncbi:MAG TPA: phosphotransferase [Acidimicrobiia bacterium]|nr:phosphotransferase [Acidimicrobiia bacterium]
MAFNLAIFNADKSTGSNFARSLNVAKQAGWGSDVQTIGVMPHAIRGQLAPLDLRVFESVDDPAEFIHRLEVAIGKPIDLVYETKSAEYMLRLSGAREAIPTFLPPHDLVQLFEDKLATQQHLAQRGFAVPQSTLVTSADDVRNFFKQWNIPRAWVRDVVGQGGRGSFFTDDPEEANRQIAEADGWGKYMIAEMLPVDSVQDWRVALSDQLLPGDMLTWSALYDNGRLVASQVRKRLYWEHSDLTPSGVTGYSGGQLVLANRSVHDLSNDIMRSFPWEPTGPVGIDFVVDNNGVPNVTEIQACRFYTSMLALADLGLNLPAMYVDVFRGQNQTYDIINPCEPGAVTVQRFGMSVSTTREQIIGDIDRSLVLMAPRFQEKEEAMSDTPMERIGEDYLRLTGIAMADAEVIHDGRQNTVLKVTDKNGTTTIARYRTAKEFWYEDCVKEPLVKPFTEVDIPQVIAFDEEHRPQLLISEFVDGELLSDTDVDEFTATKVGAALARIHVTAGHAKNFMDFVQQKTSQGTWNDDFSQSFIDTALDCGFVESDARAVLTRCADAMNRAEDRLVLLHNDFHFKNMIRRSDGEICVLDWDSASIGPAEKDFVKLLDWSHDNAAIVAHIIDTYQKATSTTLDPDLIELFRIFSDLRQISFQKKVTDIGVASQAISQGGFFATNSERFGTLNAALVRIGLQPWSTPSITGVRSL